MTRRDVVTIHLHKKLFNLFEKGRIEEQERLRNNPKLGSGFNLTQKNFSEMLAVRNFSFKIPRQKPLIDIVRKKSKRGRRK